MNSQTLLFNTPTSPLLSQPSSSCLSRPPSYNNGAIELDVLTPTTSISNTSLPGYQSVVDEDSELAGPSSISFCATRSLQIETPGIGLVRLPFPPRPDPIYIYGVSPAAEPEYISLRAVRCSGNSILARADDPDYTPLCTTTYRFGPNRPPHIRLHASAAHNEEEIMVVSRGVSTRAQTIRTPLGTFMWRFANRRERKECSAHSLLVMERITTVALEGGKQEEHRRRVAQLVRNDEFRTAGSAMSSAGNGGRLMMDLREWADTKGEAEQMEALVVASCLVMLKKEIDRRRMLQATVILSS